jgi:hypothetical protein
MEEILKRFAEARARVKDADVRKLLDQIDVDLRAALQDLDKQIATLQARLDEKDVAVTSAPPLDLARSFRQVIETIQAEARGADEVGVTIRTMDLEIKGLVEVAEKETSLVLPTAQAPVDPALLSTLRLSFRAVPTVREE